MINKVNIWMILVYLLQQGLDKLIQMINLLELASAILIHLAVTGKNMQFF